MYYGLWDMIFWLVFIYFVLSPMLKQWQLQSARLRLMRRLEEKHGSRVITLIHRQESFSFFGFSFSRFINIEDSEEVIRAIRLTPDDMPIDLIIHTPGGLVLAAEQIANAVKKHKAQVTVYVPHYAMSGGTLIALAADKIVVDENAVLGPVDPQIGNYPAASIVRTVKEKGVDKVSDETLILADISEKAIRQVRSFVYELLEDKMSKEDANTVADALTEGRWTHDYPLTYKELKGLGLNVSTELPEEIYALMHLYPQTTQRRPSVQYIPLPYHKETKGNNE